MMFGFGFIMMLFVFGIPVLLIVILLWALTKKPGSSSPFSQPTTAQVCSHCGSSLKPEWTHCPKCGAPTNFDQKESTI